MYTPMRLCLFAIIALCLISGCFHNDDANSKQSAQTSYQMGVLPPQTPELLAQEWEIYRQEHADLSEDAARHQFDIIQKMSADHEDAYTAAWAERRAQANAWLKAEVENVFHPNTVSNEMIQAAIDAYAFKSGHPALVTASHILIKPDAHSTPEMRKAALEAVRADLIQSGDLSDNALRIQAQRLIRAGYRTDMNADLTFPRYAMTSFLGEQLSYRTVVEPFADAAFKLSNDNRLSPVTESEFGYHLILFKSRTEEQKADIHRDAYFIRNSTVKQGRELATRQKIDELMQTGDIRIDETRLSQITGISNQ